MTIERAELEWRDAVLVPEEAKGLLGSSAAAPLEGWVRLGLPLVREVVADELEPAAAAQLRADAGAFRYHLLQLACSLRPPQGEQFRRAFVAVDLKAGASGQDTIAFSVDPASQTVEAGRSTKLGVTANLGLVSITAEHERTANAQLASVVAYGARTAQPSWELARVGGRELTGSYYFAVLTRSPQNVVTNGTVSLSATIEKGRLRRFEAAFPGDQVASFTIGAPA